jgi:PAS domain S-box-containing protein
MFQTVNLPPELEPLFAKAQQFVGAYFQTLHADPSHGTITIGGQRYILVRAASMSVEFFDTIVQLYRDKNADEGRAVARNLLYDLAYALGSADARAFHRELGVRDPIEKLSAGPVHFAHAGWAHVTILPQSNPVADDSFRLVYDHPYSFEAEAWRTNHRGVDFPVCIMNAGYSAGWCTESFGLPLVSVEICCKAMGDEQCRFVMATPDQIENAITSYLDAHPAVARDATAYEIPGFFRRKQIEDELRQREVQYRSIVESITDAMLIVQLDGLIAAANPAAERLYGRSQSDLVGRHLVDVTAPPSRELLTDANRFVAGNVSGEALALAADGRIFEVEYRATSFGYRHRPHILVLVSDISERKRAEAERLRLQDQLLRQNDRMRQELSLARSVQDSLLASVPPWSAERMATACRTLSAGVVSRDFCVYVDRADGRMIVAIGDMAGKGVAAALMTALTMTTIENAARQHGAPAAIIQAVEARLADQLRACEMLVALCVVVVDPRTRTIVIANAGMPPLFLLRAGSTQTIELHGLPIGVLAQGNVQARQLDLQPGDRVLVVSDGAIEARDGHGHLWGYERLRSALEAAPPGEDIAQCVAWLAATIAAFVGTTEPHDDITLLAIEPAWS